MFSNLKLTLENIMDHWSDLVWSFFEKVQRIGPILHLGGVLKKFSKYWKSPDATRRNQTQLGLIEISSIDYHSDNRWIQFIIVLGITLEYKIRIQCLLACKELNRNQNIKILFTNSEDSNTSIELNVFTPWLFMISWSFWQLRIFSLLPPKKTKKQNESNA